MALKSLKSLNQAPLFGCIEGGAAGVMSMDGLFEDFIGREDEDLFDAAGDDFDDDDDDDEEGTVNSGAPGAAGAKRKKRGRGTGHRNEDHRVERRDRNREHAKRSRHRKKFLLESLQQSVRALQQENERLKQGIREHLHQDADTLLASCNDSTLGVGTSIIATSKSDATVTLNDPDYTLVKALQTARQNFVISDPSLPDNPIVYASQGFLLLTGYTLEQVLGRNCRFLQGPLTDSSAVDVIRKGIEKGEDTTVCLLNYRADGTTFWNHFFVAGLRDADDAVVSYLGVQCEVSAEYAAAYTHFG
jgi:PAS domain S-box-containing protein